MFLEWTHGDSPDRPRTEYVLVVISNGDRFLGMFDDREDRVVVVDSGTYVDYSFGKAEYRDAIEWWTEVEFP